ncbi:MAG: hypothetical protein K6T90_19530 [Leptolyngbyaceae cyanobacterium HOT.MB2.61]|jgi:hypothetical protein|nr:hypothetical protein [Leptolyngbyaceae cyanobacterium HOT.MB2.61]
MSNTPVEVPDKISTLELSKLWLAKAFQNLERELRAEDRQKEQSSDEEDHSDS